MVWSLVSPHWIYLFTLLMIVVIVHVQVPASYVRNILIKTTNLGCLNIPDCLSTTRVLIANGYLSVWDTKDFLFVDIPFVPAVREHKVLVSLKGFLKYCSTNSNNQVNSAQTQWNIFAGKLDVNGWLHPCRAGRPLKKRIVLHLLS